MDEHSTAGFVRADVGRSFALPRRRPVAVGDAHCRANAGAATKTAAATTFTCVNQTVSCLLIKICPVGTCDGVPLQTRWSIASHARFIILALYQHIIAHSRPHRMSVRATIQSRLRARGMLTLAEIAKRLGIAAAMAKTWRRAGLLRSHRYNDRGETLFEQPGPNTPTKYHYQRKNRANSMASAVGRNSINS